MIEAWRPIAGYEGLYEISNLGSVRSARRRGTPGLLMSPVMDSKGYPSIRLSKGNVSTRYAIHRLVATAFHPGKRNALHREVAHLDGNPANCRADNLKWTSPAENSFHKRLHGTHQAGERHPRARLTSLEVDAIRASVQSNGALGATFGVGESHIRKIRAGERWQQRGPSEETASPNQSNPLDRNSNA